MELVSLCLDSLVQLGGSCVVLVKLVLELCTHGVRQRKCMVLTWIFCLFLGLDLVAWAMSSSDTLSIDWEKSS